MLFALTAIARGDPFPQASSTPAALKRLSLEDLSRIQVISAGKKEEKLSDAAAAIYVITDDEIRRSGVRSIPEALRLATGLEVAVFNNISWPISARGFDTTSANKIQVFMDGRSLYSPLFGGTFWDIQNTVMEDIDRIEVVRGPGGTLWGGNAVDCVVNIITRTAKETAGLLAVAGGGAAERGFATLRYGGAIGRNTNYRIYGNYFDRDSLALQTGADAQDPYQMRQGGFRVDSSLGADKLTLQGDLYSGDGGILNRPDIGVHGGNLLGRWSHRFGNGSELQVQTYYDRTSRLVPLQVDEERNTYDIDIQHNFQAGGHHDVVWGLGYRVSNDATGPEPVFNFSPSGRHLALFNFFVEDGIGIIPDKLKLVLGSKFENYSYNGWDVQPSARLVWTPVSHHSLWGGVSHAVRIPTQFDTDLRVTAGNFLLIGGVASFQPEELTAYEVGYTALPAPQLSLAVSGYFNHYDNLRSQETEMVGGIPAISLANKLNARTFGAEITARYQVLPWWRITSGYSNLQKRFSTDAGSTDRTGGLQEGIDPRNQFSLRSGMDLPHKTELDFWVRHVSALELSSGTPVPAYTVFDVRLGWRPAKKMEVALVARNLPDKRHLEFGPAGELIRRSVYVTTTWRF